MSARRRALLVMSISLVLAILAWIGAALIDGSEFAFGSSSEGGIASVSTELPAATCSKSFSREFPWVRIGCEPRKERAATSADGAERAAATSLDTVPASE